MSFTIYVTNNEHVTLSKEKETRNFSWLYN